MRRSGWPAHRRAGIVPAQQAPRHCLLPWTFFSSPPSTDRYPYFWLDTGGREWGIPPSLWGEGGRATGVLQPGRDGCGFSHRRGAEARRIETKGPSSASQRLCGEDFDFFTASQPWVGRPSPRPAPAGHLSPAPAGEGKGEQKGRGHSSQGFALG